MAIAIGSTQLTLSPAPAAVTCQAYHSKAKEAINTVLASKSLSAPDLPLQRFVQLRPRPLGPLSKFHLDSSTSSCSRPLRANSSRSRVIPEQPLQQSTGDIAANSGDISSTSIPSYYWTARQHRAKLHRKPLFSARTSNTSRTSITSFLDYVSHRINYWYHIHQPDTAKVQGLSSQQQDQSPPQIMDQTYWWHRTQHRKWTLIGGFPGLLPKTQYQGM